MEWDRNAISKSFEKQLEFCHDTRKEPIRPIDLRVSDQTSQIPILLPAVEDESLKQLLMAWYYAGYYTGKHQAFKEMGKPPSS